MRYKEIVGSKNYGYFLLELCPKLWKILPRHVDRRKVLSVVNLVQQILRTWPRNTA